MPVVIVPGTPHAEEILKFEYAEYRIGDDCGKRGPRTFQEFPKALYKAGRNAKNQIDLQRNGQGDILIQTADDADDQRRLEAQGWVEGPDQAIARCERDERDVAKLAANRAFQERRMSPEAQAEARAYDESVSEHVAEIPATPIKKRGRKVKLS